MESPSVELAL
ncbi:hypothetical protein D020_0700A, partial [Vibrio parahaemolyticus SBR10290]